MSFLTDDEARAFEIWMEQFVAINSNPKIGTTGIPMMRKDYYRTYFTKDTDPKKIYEQSKRINEELKKSGAITNV